MSRKLSVVTPLYNTEKRFLDDLKECLDPYKDDVEWVLVNDSPNNKKLNQYLQKLQELPYTNIIVHEKNKGIFEAYTTGFLNASSEYCCILDHDDVYNPRNVIEALKDRPDMVYTDEYKFDNWHSFDKYKKPDFDLLSICFYFYTHHVTVMKTKIVKDILIKKGNPGGYTSLFDIHITLEYLSKFIGKKFRVKHIDSADYGWRVYENSTAANLGQKPSGYFERLRKVEEFFNDRGETPILSINENLGYIVEGQFMSLYDLIKYPLEYSRFVEFFSENSQISRNGNSIRLDGKVFDDKELQYYYKMLIKIPALYLLQQRRSHFFIPVQSKGKLISPKNYKLHPSGVPFMKRIKRDIGIEGMWIDLALDNSDGYTYAILMK